MYALKKKMDKIGGFQITSDYLVYTQTSDEYKYQIFVKNNLDEIIFISEEEKINRFYLFETFLVYSSRIEKLTHLVDLKTREEKKINETLNNLLPNSNNIYENIYYSTFGQEDNLVYDLKTGKVLFNLKLKLNGDFVNNEKYYLITGEGNTIFKYDKTNYSLNWEKNLSEETSYTDWDGKLKKDKINCVKSWKDRLLVLTKCYLLCLNLEGDILYKIKFPDLLRAQTLIINENRGYIYNYHDYLVVDIEKGEPILHKEISSFNYQSEKYNNFAQDLIYHQGLLYHSVNSSGLSFVVAINPSTGDTIWRQHVTGQSINSMRFDEDKMYILDGGSTLHIFEKELLT